VLADARYVVVNLARQIEPGDVVFTGVNSAVPTAACLLAKRAYPFGFTHLNVAGGVDARPRALPASSGDPALLTGTAATSTTRTSTTPAAAASTSRSSAPRRSSGRPPVTVNAIGSWQSPQVRLPGGGGAAVMMPTARRAVVWQTSHSPRRLVERVDFATSAGASTLVTPLAVFARPGEGGFALVSYRPDQTVADIRELNRLRPDAASALPTTAPTPDEELELERPDPDRVARP
jgi:glutaconate CoA-transferase subunit B